MENSLERIKNLKKNNKITEKEEIELELLNKISIALIKLTNG